MAKPSPWQLKNVQLFIADLLNNFTSQDDVDRCSAKNFCVTGTVVNIVMSPAATDLGEVVSKRPVVYELDDGTGILRVAHFIGKKVVLQNKQGIGAQGSSNLVKDVNDMVLKGRTAFAIGTCVEAKGVIKWYRDSLELLAFNVREVTDVNDEIDRILAMGDLRDRGVYKNLKTTESAS